MACILIGGTLFSSCDRDEEDLTTVKLSVFGPSPALRGGELKFIGTNLDKATAIVLQPNIEITEFVSKTATELVITIPQNAMPGKVTLKTPQGNIETKTPLTFSEPISIENFAPATVKAGDKLTINGDYLNLIAQVIFSDGVTVDSTNFVSQSRYKIEVTVPVEAQTGKVIVSNGAEIPVMVFTATELNVTLPKFTAVSPNPVKPGTALQINGTDFQLVKEIIFSDNLKVSEFTVNAEKTQITVNVPETAKEGILKMVALSGVETEYAEELKLVGPAVTGIAPAPVKNGAMLTITGTNLDLVTEVVFGGDVKGVISSFTATTLEVAVPLTATEGKVTLNTHSGKTAETEALTLVKPTITSIAPLALMAGNNITINGTDLDLVRQVKFVGGLTVDVTPATATSFEVTVPPACVGSDVVTLITTNGSEVASTDQLVVEAANKPVITKINASVKPGAKLTIEGTKLHLVEAIYFQPNVKAVLYGVRTETSIEVFVPETAKKGAVTLKLVAFNGDEVISPEFTISGTDPVVDASYVFFNFDNKGSWWGDKGAPENDPELSLDGSSYFRLNHDMNPWWTGFFWRNGRNDLKTDGVTVNEWAVKLDVNVLADVTGDMKLRLKGTDGDFWAVIHGLENKGGWYTVTIPLTSFIIDGGTTVIPNVANVDSDFGMAYTGPGEHVNMCIDNVRFEKISDATGAPKFKLIGF
jgi:hypothetical protein